jgi:hypothetical protein
MSISLSIDTNLAVSYRRYLRYLLFRKLRSNVHRHSSPPPKQSASSRVQLGQSHLVRESGPRKQQRNDDRPMHSEARAHERTSLPPELLGNASRGSRPDPAHAYWRPGNGIGRRRYRRHPAQCPALRNQYWSNRRHSIHRLLIGGPPNHWRIGVRPCSLGFRCRGIQRHKGFSNTVTHS